jgi:hypothetical protein
LYKIAQEWDNDAHKRILGEPDIWVEGLSFIPESIPGDLVGGYNLSRQGNSPCRKRNVYYFSNIIYIFGKNSMNIPYYSGLNILGCSFKNAKFTKKTLKAIVKQYGGVIS